MCSYTTNSRRSVRGRAASSLVEGAASEVHVELLEATALVERLGRGVVYFGSARLGVGGDLS